MFLYRTGEPLTFLKIAEHWSREYSPTATVPELRGAMFHAWWLGELHGVGSPDRLRALRLLFNHAQHRIAFIGPGLPPSPNSWVDTDDGGAVVTSFPEVKLPGAVPEKWTQSSCEEAFRAVAEQWVEINIESDDVLGPIFDVFATTSEEFFAWLKKIGASRPTFWEQPPANGTKQRREGKSAARLQCAKWLRGEMQRGPQVGPQSKYFDLAKRCWGQRLSGRQFKSVWSAERKKLTAKGWPGGGVPQGGWPNGDIKQPSP